MRFGWGLADGLTGRSPVLVAVLMKEAWDAQSHSQTPDSRLCREGAMASACKIATCCQQAVKHHVPQNVNQMQGET